jgi:hypothetical protein
VEGSCAHAFEDAEALALEALDLDCNYAVRSAHTADLMAAVASAVARHTWYSVATEHVVEGGVAEEGVANIDLAASEVWTGPVRGVLVALEAARELDSLEQERRMRPACPGLSDAIRRVAGVLEGVLVEQAHGTAAAVASIARAVPLRRRLLVRLGSRIE